MARQLSGRVLAGQGDGGLGNVVFTLFAAARQALDHMAVVVAGGKVHGAVHRGRVFAQGLLDDAHALDKLAPVGGREQAQAADAVADRHLVGRLLLGFQLDQVLDAQARFRQQLFDPGQRQGQRGALALQAPSQFGDE